MKIRLIFFCDNCEKEWDVFWNTNKVIKAGDLNCPKCYPGVEVK